MNFVKVQDFVGLEITPKALMFEDFSKMLDLLDSSLHLKIPTKPWSLNFVQVQDFVPGVPRKTLESKFC